MANIDIFFDNRNNKIINITDMKDFILGNKNFENNNSNNNNKNSSNNNLYLLKNKNNEKLTENDVISYFNTTQKEEEDNKNQSQSEINDDRSITLTTNTPNSSSTTTSTTATSTGINISNTKNKVKDNHVLKWGNQQNSFTEKIDSKITTTNNNEINELFSMNTNFSKTYDNFYYSSGKKSNSSLNNFNLFSDINYHNTINNIKSFESQNFNTTNTFNNVNDIALYKNIIHPFDNDNNNRINLQIINNNSNNNNNNNNNNNKTGNSILESNKNIKIKKMKQTKSIKKKTLKRNDKQRNFNSIKDGEQNSNFDQDFQYVMKSINDINVNDRQDNDNYNIWNNTVEDYENNNNNINNNNNMTNFKKKKGKNGIPKKGKTGNGHSKYYKELVCEKCGEKPTQYGLLTECDHIFCLECIKKIWRVPESDSEKFSHKCPICNIPSFHFIPSDIYCHSGPLKKHIIDRFRTRCSRISCKFYERVRHDGSHYCPFGQIDITSQI
ncbi:hypothetical protein U3516DRAFT_822039 [Neocallimastix sp. 'constans']